MSDELTQQLYDDLCEGKFDKEYKYDKYTVSNFGDSNILPIKFQPKKLSTKKVDIILSMLKNSVGFYIDKPISCVYVDVDNECMVGTDGHIMSLIRLKDELSISKEDYNCFYYRKLNHNPYHEYEKCALQHFKEKKEIVKFPNYKVVLPDYKDMEHTLTLNVADVLAWCKVATKINRKLHKKKTDDWAVVHAMLNVDDITVIFNPEVLLRIFNVIADRGHTELTCKIDTPTRAVIIHASHEKYVVKKGVPQIDMFLVMPLRPQRLDDRNVLFAEIPTQKRKQKNEK